MLHDVTAHMWRLGISGLDLSLAITLSRASPLGEDGAEHDADAIRVIKQKEEELLSLLRGSIAAEQHTVHLRNYLQTLLSRSETISNQINSEMGATATDEAYGPGRFV